MFNKKSEKIGEEKKPTKSDMVEIVALKDFVIHFNEIHIELVKGEVAEVPAMFIDNLKAEKVIGGE